MYRTAFEVADIPAVLCAPEEPGTGPARPVVLVGHGLGGEKEDTLEQLERLASRGYVALALDAVGHGARRTADFEARFDGEPAVQERAFYDVIEHTAAELPGVLDDLEARGLLAGAGIALVGTSLGGFVALATRPLDERVAVVVSIAGSPRWPGGRSGSPEEHLDTYWPCAVLLLHGEDDDVVPPGPGLAFVEGLRPLYRDDPDRLRRVTLPGEGHLFSPDAQTRVDDEIEAWLARWLPSPRPR